MGYFSDIDKSEEMDSWLRVTVPNHRVWPVYPDGRRKLMVLNPEVLEWLSANVGLRSTIRQDGVWCNTIPMADYETTFSFKDHKLGLLFKLTWG